MPDTTEFAVVGVGSGNDKGFSGLCRLVFRCRGVADRVALLNTVESLLFIVCVDHCDVGMEVPVNTSS